jgi:hypothetical protein
MRNNITTSEAQREIRQAYVNGGPGAFVSSLIWLAAAIVERSSGVASAFTALFFGGFLIFPLSMLLSRVIFRRPGESADNPLRLIALESTIAMVGGLLCAWLFVRLQPAFTFPAAAIAVGTHYFPFKTLYGDKRYWLFGALLTAIGMIEIAARGTLPGGPILAFAVVEFLFAIWLTFGLSQDR